MFVERNFPYISSLVKEVKVVGLPLFRLTSGNAHTHNHNDLPEYRVSQVLPWQSSEWWVCCSRGTAGDSVEIARRQLSCVAVE